MRDAVHWAHSLRTPTVARSALAALAAPTLVMVGGRSAASGRAPASALLGQLPRGERLDVPELGHMGPVTHPASVDAAIAAFLERAG